MLIRDRVLELLEEGDATVTELANRLDALTNTVSKALAHARENGGAHIVAYVRQAAVYRLGPGEDCARHSPVSPVPSKHEYRPLPAKELGASESVLEYFEYPELLGIKQFSCTRLRATLSISSCSDRYEKANGNSPEVYADRYHACRRCPIGAAHSGRQDANLSTLRGATICGRCHTGVARLISRHLCISCYNRQREFLIGRNAKGTKPRKLTHLDQRSITYLAGGVVKTRTIAETVDMEELIVAVLRDEEHAPQFGWRAPASMDWLRDDLYDRSIGDAVEVAGVAAVADSAQEKTVTPIVASVLGQVAVPILADTAAAVGVDQFQALRDAVERLDSDTQAGALMTLRRAAKKHRQQARRKIRLSNVTVQLMRGVGALPPSPPVLVPAPAAPSYSAYLMSGVGCRSSTHSG